MTGSIGGFFFGRSNVFASGKKKKMELNPLDAEEETLMAVAFKKVALEEIQHQADRMVPMAVIVRGTMSPLVILPEEVEEFEFGGGRKKAFKDEVAFEASSSVIRTRIRLTLTKGREHGHLTMVMERGDEARVCIRRWGAKNLEELHIQQKLEMMATNMLDALTKLVDGV